MKRQATLLVTLVLSAMLVAQATAQGVEQQTAREDIEAREGQPITFYGHVLAHGRGSPVPMNTQFPDGSDDYSRGTFGNCGTFMGVPTGPASGSTYTGSCEDHAGNENWWFTTPGFVQIKSLNDFDYEDLHNERGQTKDIFFDLDQQITSTFYHSADWHAWAVLFCGVSLCWNWDPGYNLDWVHEVTVYHGSLGEHHGSASEAPDMNMILNSEDTVTIAYGRDGPKPVSSFDPTLQAVAGPLCDGPCDTVVPFHPVLDYTEEFIASGGVVPKENDIVVRHQWYQETNGERYILGVGVVVGTAWNINGGEDYPANIIFPIKNPLDVELVFPRFIHDKLVILSVLNTPWGSYDVDLESIQLEIRDANDNVVPVDPNNIFQDLDVSVAHSGHYNPIDVNWVWDYQKEKLPAGTYTAAVKARNFQGSYNTETLATFEITADGTGGTVSYGTDGLLSFTDNQFDQFSSNQRNQAGDAPVETESVDGEESKDSPGLGILVLLGAVAVIARGRRK